ncbi:NAC transcription factor 32-like [Tripterygium wilfordii]|nr:NAC transcription factor 32-like [Tripterygium wilfordii]
MNLPPGYRFNPTAEELLMSYLLPRRNNEAVPGGSRIVRDVVLYGKYDPWTLFGVTDGSRECCFFVFTDLKKLSAKNGRPKPNGRKIRSAGSGVWSSRTVNDVKDGEGNVIGVDRYYVFSTGENKNKKQRRNGHGHWTMHEYCLVDSNGRCIDDLVVCVVACNTQIVIKHSDIGNSKKRIRTDPSSSASSVLEPQPEEVSEEEVDSGMRHRTRKKRGF